MLIILYFNVYNKDVEWVLDNKDIEVIEDQMIRISDRYSL